MDIALKQRLVGATVLIALAVVVLPMLLGGRPDGTGGEGARIEIAERPEELGFEKRRFPVGAEPPPAAPAQEPAAPLDLPAPSRTGPSNGPHDAAKPAADGSDVAQGAPGPAVEPAAAETAHVQDEPEPQPAAPAAAEETMKAPAGRYVVQVASFGSVANAEKLSTQLAGLGYGVMNDTVTSDVGTLHRVRVGPYASEAEAAKAVARLREQVEGSKPRLMDLQPGKAERVTEPSDPLVRWVVQVGSFSRAANADSLVAKLRLEGLSAYKEEVGSAGSTIYRVRVGPFVERDEAIRVDRLVGERLSLDGVVMSAD
jgi:DedD protein